jgi:outer membrane immunogenic protein
MRKAAIGIVAVAATIGTPVLAADMVVKAPLAPAPVYSWTGWYVGGNVGYGWGDAQTDIAASTTNISAPGILPVQNSPTTFAGSHSERLDGFVGGGQFGYNFQFSPRWVLGFEADIQGSGERGNNASTDPLAGALCIAIAFGIPNNICDQTAPLSGAAVTSFESNIDWFGTVRGRLGVLVNDGLLLYGTAGIAFGQVSVSGNTNINATLITSKPASFGPGGGTFSQSKTNTGLALGGGLEGRLSAWLPPNWTWKLEYLYIDLGSLDTSTPVDAPSSVPLGGYTDLVGTANIHAHFADNIVRIGLNYQFH